jgi:hypothetical protein
MNAIKIGDTVTRYIGGIDSKVKMNLKVTDIKNGKIVCGAWKFDRVTGGEIDKDLNWTSYRTGAIIRPIANEIQ